VLALGVAECVHGVDRAPRQDGADDAEADEESFVDAGFLVCSYEHESNGDEADRTSGE
jgi:hypothetical protein